LGLARIVALGVALAVAGCVTKENSLSQADIAGMKLTGVTVSFTPEAIVQWEDGIRAYATSQSISDDEIATAPNTAEGKAYVRNMLALRIKAGVERAMGGQLAGTRPVRLDIVVKSFAIASVVQRILIGGGRGMRRCQPGRCANRSVDHRLSRSYGGTGDGWQRACRNRGAGGDRQRFHAESRRKAGRYLRRQLSPVAFAFGRLIGSATRFALAIGAWPMLETARTGRVRRFPAGV
jgi:hypothetical protein